MGDLTVVVGGQYGSEGKGAVAGYLCRPEELGDGMAIRVGGPNAGHSVVDPATGKKWALRQVPVAAVVNPHAWLAIAPGSEIDPVVLLDEVERLETAGFKVKERLLVDPAATVITNDHVADEALADLTGRLGSTGKGIGAARADRVWRQAKTAKDFAQVWGGEGVTVTNTHREALTALRQRRPVLIEGAQGYGLGLHTDHYPKTTSSDCTAIDFLSMAGLSPWHPTVRRFAVWMAVRPYPIRVAGDSGPLFRETTWTELGLPEEKTTVTQKTRRVGHWDGPLVEAAAIANGGPNGAVRIALTMADQIDPHIAGATSLPNHTMTRKLDRLISTVQNDSRCKVWLVGTGPDTMIDLRRGVIW